jgi:hypothetical protein
MSRPENRGRRLTWAELEWIDFACRRGKSLRETSEWMDRSHTCVLAGAARLGLCFHARPGAPIGNQNRRLKLAA